MKGNLKEENMSDLDFLKEIKENVVLGKLDTSRHELALEMLDDWIKELAELGMKRR